MVHQVGEDAELVARQPDRNAVESHSGATRIERDPAPAELRGDLSAGAADRISGIAKRGCDLLRQQRFVFDDQDPHTAVIAQTTLNGA
jgi:hypothetical protein